MAGTRRERRILSAAAMRMIPLTPTVRSIRLWFGEEGSNPPPPTVPVRRDASTTVPVAVAWQRAAPKLPFWVGRGELGSLQPDTRYTLETQDGSASGRVTCRTLPERIPGELDPSSLVLLLGSCFSIETGAHGALARGLASLPASHFPHLKLLCGDQVYLDLPVREDLPQELDSLRAKLLSKYQRNWEHGPGEASPGFGRFLRNGCNLFTSDDHEYWNNYPFKQAHLPITLFAPKNYQQASQELFRAFQAGDPDVTAKSGLQRVRIGAPGAALEIVALDGRYHRTEDRAHLAKDLAALDAWIRGLTGPGILVLSQPLFEEPAGGFKRRFVDAWLANFDDYPELIRALDAARHDVLVLSGDIHRARYARTQRGLAPARMLHEVVASPLSLIGEGSHSKSAAHDRFPDPAVSGVAKSDVRTQLPGLGKDQFATLTIHDTGGRLAVELQYWSFQTGLARVEWSTSFVLG